MLKCIREMRFDDMKKEFAKLGVPITKPDRDWPAILGMKAVRNCITHVGGHPDKELAKKLAKYKIPVDQSKMVLPEGYFAECVDLVEDACKRIAKGCQDALKEGRVKVKETHRVQPDVLPVGPTQRRHLVPAVREGSGLR